MREKFNDFFMTVVGVIIGGSFLILMNNGLAYVPQIETWISPVVVFSPVKVTYRDENKACFALPIEKRAAAVPIKYEFFVEAKLSSKIVVSAYIANDDWTKRSPSDLENHPVGSKWTRRYCFELPSTIADFQPLRVSGYALHRRHAVYDTRTNIDPFVIAALSGS